MNVGTFRGRILLSKWTETFDEVVIQVGEVDDAKAWAILQRNSPGVALPNRTFVVSHEALAALRQAGVRPVVLSEEADVV
jgi:hypothetical protein